MDNTQVEKLKAYLKELYSSDRVQNGNPDLSPTLPGLQKLAGEAAGHQTSNIPGIPVLPGVDPRPGEIPPPYDGKSIQNYADGGEVQPDDGIGISKNMKLSMQGGHDDGDTYGGVGVTYRFADGGMVSGDDFLSSLKNGTSGMTEAPPAFDPGIGLPPAPAPAPMAAPTHTPVDPAISQYLASQKAQLGRFGPDEQMATTQHILQSQNGISGRVGDALSGLGDSLMAIGGKQSPGFQQNYRNRQNQQAAMQLDALKGARQANREDVSDKSKLDAQDPNSPLSASKRAQQGPVLQALGIDPKTMSAMSAADMEGAISLLSTAGIENRKIMVAQIKNAIEGRIAVENSRHNRTQEGIEGVKAKEAERHNVADEAAKTEEIGTHTLEEAAKVPFTSRVANMFGMNPAQEALEKKAGLGDNTTPHGVPDLGSTFNGGKVLKVKRIK